MDKVVYETAYDNLMRTAEVVEKLLNKKYEHNSKRYIELEALIRNVKGKILETMNTSNYTDVEITSKGLYEILRYVFDRLDLTWDDKYEMAKVYYEHYGNLLIDQKFRTNNGYEYDENGIFRLGEWMSMQRLTLKNIKNDTSDQSKIREERIRKLEQIGMVWDGLKARSDEKWEAWYKEAQKCYEKFGNLLVPQTYEQNGKKLGLWISNQRKFLKIKEDDTPEQRKDKENKRARLELLGMEWEGKIYDQKWEERYKEAQLYFEKNGHLLIPVDYVQNGKRIGNWIFTQRRLLQIKEDDTPEQRRIKEDRRAKLEQIGMVWDGIKALADEKWEEWYKEAQKCYEKNGNLLVPVDYEQNGKKLGIWIRSQRQKLKIKKNDTPEQRMDKEDKRARLDQIGMVWDGKKVLKDEEWEEWYKEAQEYYEKNGHLIVPRNYEQNGRKLGVWIGMQRTRLKIKDSDTPEKRQDKEKKRARLEQIGMVWNAKKVLFDADWEQWYKVAQEYYEQNGHLIVPTDYEQNGKKLGVWIGGQRTNLRIKDSDTSEQRKNKENKRARLEQIGMVWNGHRALADEQWETWYKEAQKYYEKNGNLVVPQKYEENGKKLGVWIATQRGNLQIKESDTPEQRRDKESKRARLEQIGMVWNSYKVLANEGLANENWEEMYKEAQKYYEENGNLVVPQKYEENGKKLGVWIVTQRNGLQLKEDDTPEQRLDKENKRTRLEQIGMVWNGRKARSDEQWEERYKEAREYYEENGNLVVPWDYVQNGKKLGSWIGMQRNGLKLKEDDTPEQRKDKENKRARLELIGMIWDVVGNRYDVLNICVKYGINVARNSEIISNISLKEFESKIEYLRVQGIPYVTNGVLHEIFNMSSRNIEKKYGVNLEFIITNFYVDDKGKGLN